MLNNVKKHGVVFAILIGLLLTFTACSKDADGATSDKKNTGQVTIKIALPLDEDYFNGRFGEVDKKLENINLEYIPYGNSVESLEELFAEKQSPDIIIGDYQPIRHLDIDYPLDDLIEENNFDLDRIDPSLLSFMRSLDKEGNIVGFPDGGSFFGLYYNKEVFDKMGQDYPDPDDPMTWDELIELAKDMTKEVGGVQYIGLQGGPGAALGEQAARMTDPDSGEVLVEKDPVFKKYFELMEAFYNIPGLDDPDLPEDPFVEEQTAAMVIASNNYFAWGWGNPDPEEIKHIDIAPIPVWEDQPNTTPAKNAWPMVINDYSEHKEEAFEVLTTYLDPEIQIGMAKTMMLQTPLTDPEVLKNYGSEVPTYDGKNIDAYFFGEAAKYKDQQSNWDEYVDIGEAEEKLKEDKVDIVTLLRELAEESDGKIKSAKEEQ
jgi:ABC-type glycerol-3-phosphate transport system substrate-binding protein